MWKPIVPKKSVSIQLQYAILHRSLEEDRDGDRNFGPLKSMRLAAYHACRERASHDADMTTFEELGKHFRNDGTLPTEAVSFRRCLHGINVHFVRQPSLPL